MGSERLRRSGRSVVLLALQPRPANNLARFAPAGIADGACRSVLPQLVLTQMQLQMQL
jgi:hypothetical protein